MSRLFCVDIGNSRLKWAGPGDTQPTSLPLNNLNTWLNARSALGAVTWAVAGVNPPAIAAFTSWATTTKFPVKTISHYSQLPIKVNVEQPSAVGIDRLLGVLAASRLIPPGARAVTVDVGTAVTVNLLETDGAFVGGAIFPGPRLMAEALHDKTAKLPALDIRNVDAPPAPGTNTETAIRIGIAHAVKGGVLSLIRSLTGTGAKVHLFLTGGGIGTLGPTDFESECASVTIRPTLVLDGIRIAAEMSL